MDSKEKKQGLKKISLQKTSLQKTNSQKTNSQETSLQKTNSQKTNSQETSLQKTNSQEISLQKISLQKMSFPNKGKKRLFGTDGIRGKSGVYPMTPDMVVKIGQALGHILHRNKKKEDKVKVVIGKDTRISGYMVEQALACGLNSVGVYVQLIGPMPTPGIGFLAQNMRANAGIIISASHNPYCDNGIKIFDSDGYKISDELELEIEDLVLNKNLTSLLVQDEHIGRTKRIDDAAGRYIVFAKSTFPLDINLENLRVVLDSANGAAYKVAPMVFEELGAEVFPLNITPNGFNINSQAGALHPESLSDAVKTYRADLGIALDGDADRIILVDEKGKIVDGDIILATAAIHLKEEGRLKGNKVVVTKMSNSALDEYLKKEGIETLRVAIGDKNVVKAMRELDICLGGEQSGHIVFSEHSTTGDGIVAALKILEIMKRKKKPLSSFNSMLDPYPQVQINVEVKNKVPLEKIEGYLELHKEKENDLKGEGRILIRYSGTENLARVLVEGKNKSQITSIAHDFEKFLKTNLL